MMLATRVIPVLLKRGSALVKGEHFNPWRSVGVAIQAARVHASRHVDELIILDVTATAEGRGPDFAAIRELTDDCFCPLTVGGGVKTIDDIRSLLAVGADKVAIGAACRDTELVRRAASMFGGQAIVAIIDHDEQHMVANRISAVSWAVEMQYWGAGEILLQARERDGTMGGYDLTIIERVSRAVNIPVIACGGCRDYQDMVDAITVGASAVAAGAMFQFSDATPLGASQYLAAHGIEARIPA